MAKINYQGKVIDNAVVEAGRAFVDGKSIARGAFTIVEDRTGKFIRTGFAAGGRMRGIVARVSNVPKDEPERVDMVDLVPLRSTGNERYTKIMRIPREEIPALIELLEKFK